MTQQKAWDNVPCETVHYGAWDTGTRTIYQTPVPLWEESIRSGHPILGNISNPIFTAFPSKLPAVLPPGAVEMGRDVGASVPYFWIFFGENEDAAFTYAMQE